MTTRNHHDLASEKRTASARFVGAAIRLSHDGRHVLHFLGGGLIVCRPVDCYRQLLVKTAGTAAVPASKAARASARLMIALRLALVALALLQPFLREGLWVEVAATMCELLGAVLEALAGHGLAR